jgi:hypothetical protein
MSKRYIGAGILLFMIAGLSIALRGCGSDRLKPPQPRPPSDPDRPRVSRLQNTTLLIDGAEPATIVRGQTYELSGEFDLETADMEVPGMMADLIVTTPKYGEVTCAEAFVTATRVHGRHCTFTGQLQMTSNGHGPGELKLIYFENEDRDDPQQIVLRKPVTLEAGVSESQ